MILLIKCKQLNSSGLAGGFLFIVANGTKDWSVDREKKYVQKKKNHQFYLYGKFN